MIDDDACAQRAEQVTRLVLCSGKVYIDLACDRRASAKDPEAERVGGARVEELYPFPAEELQAVMAGYPNLRELVWLQEEPQNMGAWSFMAPRLRD